MDITFKGQHTVVNERFRVHATGKLAKLERMGHQASRIEVEVCLERNPRLASQKERVELTIRSRGPAIRAEAAAEDRFAALDLALDRLDSRLRRALDRRKNHHAGKVVRLVDLPEAEEDTGRAPARGRRPEQDGAAEAADGGIDELPIPADGGPLFVRQKFHQAGAMTIDQALLEMELVGHDFYLFRDLDGGMPSVVYRRRGYQYGVIRLVDAPAGPAEPGTGRGSRRAGRNGRADAAGRRGQRQRAGRGGLDDRPAVPSRS
jgi:ribosomal subunit interface protein